MQNHLLELYIPTLCGLLKGEYVVRLLLSLGGLDHDLLFLREVPTIHNTSVSYLTRKQFIKMGA